MGNVSLHDLARDGRDAEIRLRKTLDPIFFQVDAVNENNETALIIAARAGQKTTCHVLCDLGADPAHRGKNGITALHAASSGGFPAIVCLLLERGAPIDAEDAEGSTPLTHACFRDRDECVLALINAGADAAKKNMYGKSSLDLVKDASKREQLVEHVRSLVCIPEESSPTTASAPPEPEPAPVPEPVPTAAPSNVPALAPAPARAPEEKATALGKGKDTGTVDVTLLVWALAAVALVLAVLFFVPE